MRDLVLKKVPPASKIEINEEQYELPENGGVYRISWKEVKPEFAKILEAAGKEVRFHSDGTAEVKNLITVARELCLPIRILHTVDGEEFIELAWARKGKVFVRAYPGDVIRDGRKLLAAAGQHGFPIIAATAKEVEKWLDDVDAWSDLEVVTIARQLGWQPDSRTFVTSDGAPYQVIPAHAGLGRFLRAHRQSGTLEEWKTIIEKIEYLPLAQMGIYGALGSTLLRPLGLLSFALHYTGSSTGGKTSSLRVGGSVWGEPSEEGVIGNWKGTALGLQRRLSLMRGLPVVLDETTSARSNRLIKDILYALPQGDEGTRGAPRGLLEGLTWSTIVLSSGEASILSGIRDQGAAARGLDLAGRPFGPDGGALADEVREGLAKVYGSAGPAFVAALLPSLKGRGLGRIRERHRALAESSSWGGSIAKRRAAEVAVLRLAAELAAEFGVLPFQPPELGKWRDLFTYDDSRDDQPGEARKVVLDAAKANAQGVLDYGASPREGNAEGHYGAQREWIGTRTKDRKLALWPAWVERTLEAGGYSLDAVKGSWAERGWIERQGRDLMKKVHYDGAYPRMLVFEPIEEEGSEDP